MTLAIILGLPNRCTAFWCSPARPRRCDSPELLSLRWADMEWEQSRIAVSKRWSKGKDGPTKTRKSEGHIPMHPILAVYLNEWRDHTPYAKDTDFLFPSLKAEGKVPLSPAVFLADHLRRQPKRHELSLRTAKGLECTICGIPFQAGW